MLPLPEPFIDLLHARSAQQIVDLLQRDFFDRRVTSCILLLYGSDTEFAQPGQRAYLMLQGTWSRRVGSGVASGIRLYMTEYADLVARLDAEDALYFDHPADIRAQFDPLVRGFLHSERVRSLALIALKGGRQAIGVLLIASDRPHAFDDARLRYFRAISAHVTLNLRERMLREGQQQLSQMYDAVIDAVNDGVIMVLPFDRGGRVTIVNGYFRRLFEVRDQVGAGESLIDLLARMRIFEATRADLRARWLSVPPRAPTVLQGEFAMITSEGQPKDIAWYSAPVLLDGSVMGRIYTFHDVTPERAAQKVRAAFLSRLSHELRTPLTSIRGFAEFILEATADQLPSLAREYTEIILNSARHLTNLFTDLIEITRAEAGELKLNRREAHLPDIIIDAVARLEFLYRQRGQQMVLELDDDLPVVMVDIDRIAQVVTNLISNASKYSPEKSKITVRTLLVSTADALPVSAPHDIILPAIMVTVLDQGAGLSPEDAEQVFMPFYRAEEVKKARIDGAGLGLAVARSIIEVHRGRIWAAPRTEARGGSFMFTIPTP